MSIQALSDYTLYSRYSKYRPEKKRRETWHETVDRVFDMHKRKFEKELNSNDEFKELFRFSKSLVHKKVVLGSQRALQFGGSPIERHNEKIYNCAVSYVDRPRSFQEIMFMLLCGCGVGFSVQNCHIDKLPTLCHRQNKTKTYIVEDSIEGWANAVGVLVNSYFTEPSPEWKEYACCKIKFDTSQIRPQGDPINGGFKAPGPKGLRNALSKIKKLIERRLKTENRLRPIDAYDIIMHASDAVLSGGVRRSATICVFSYTDTEMVKAKTGNWYAENPQRARSNNSALLLRGKVTKEEFYELIEFVKEYGEPGFVWAETEDILYNPCVEIGFCPALFNKAKEIVATGVQFCNLCELNGKKCKTEDDFYKACVAAAFIGTLQAAYTDFPYLGQVSEEIVRKEALLGCSITGMMDSPDILFDKKIQRKGAKIIKEINAKVAKWIGINPAARTTCVKPAGSTSCILGTSSGIHPHHAKRYIRRVQANKLEFPLAKFTEVNPLAVEESVWSANNTDMVISFLCEVPPGAITKNQLSAIELLEKVRTTHQNWVEYGTTEERCSLPHIRHNVSNTITVMPHEWKEVASFIYRNRGWFAGISLLPASGDKDYPQAPFTTVYSPAEIVKEYGDASVFASGLIVEALRVFDNNLWKACDAVLQDLFAVEVDDSLEDDCWAELKRRMIQFADRYFNGDTKQMTYCLKDVYNWKTWCDLSREYKEIDWSSVIELDENTVDIDTLGAISCAGQQCEIKF